MDGVNHRQHLMIRGSLALGINPGVTSQNILREVRRCLFMISFSRFRRAFSARSLESSMCSSVATLVPTPLSLPSFAALIQLRSAWL
ncbi:hypothetical protein D3871_25850 [Noviherbaspirillum saxi]|uniref:Uncharacterized protein n=1 Tax=Noviherbaspirillum saxi TaxID=2320863 RepID=A0A3A3FG57_9BURK|nr:hypothetical protein D3871_25850 [Noviherbaspirillum saxi]